MTFQQALNKCMDICSRREYCSYDVLEKLRRWELPEPDAEKIIEQLKKDRFISHERYCQAFVSDKIKFNHWGKIKIAYYLKQKQLEHNIIQDALETIDDNLYAEIIRSEIKKKQKTVKAKSDYEKQGKVAQSVIAKGFEPALVFELLKNKS
ncbi:MAG: regulatory protein RecX [Salinivirgaceae bacterium]